MMAKGSFPQQHSNKLTLASYGYKKKKAAGNQLWKMMHQLLGSDSFYPTYNRLEIGVRRQLHQCLLTPATHQVTSQLAVKDIQTNLNAQVVVVAELCAEALFKTRDKKQ